MANQYFPTLVVAVAGTGGSTNLIASATGQSIRIWQLIVSGTAADTTVIVTFTAGGVATTLRCAIGAAATILPMTGTPWALADVGTAITFTAAATTTVTAYYTKAIGG